MSEKRGLFPMTALKAASQCRGPSLFCASAQSIVVVALTKMLDIFSKPQALSTLCARRLQSDQARIYMVKMRAPKRQLATLF